MLLFSFFFSFNAVVKLRSPQYARTSPFSVSLHGPGLYVCGCVWVSEWKVENQRSFAGFEKKPLLRMLLRVCVSVCNHNLFIWHIWWTGEGIYTNIFINFTYVNDSVVCFVCFVEVHSKNLHGKSANKYNHLYWVLRARSTPPPNYDTAVCGEDNQQKHFIIVFDTYIVYSTHKHTHTPR